MFFSYSLPKNVLSHFFFEVKHMESIYIDKLPKSVWQGFSFQTWNRHKKHSTHHPKREKMRFYGVRRFLFTVKFNSLAELSIVDFH